MSLEGIVASLQQKKVKDCLTDIKGMKCLSALKLPSGRTLSIAERDNSVFIVIKENDNERRILAEFRQEDEGCTFLTFYIGGSSIGFGTENNISFENDKESIIVRNESNGNKGEVRFFEEDGVMHFHCRYKNSTISGFLES